MRKIFRRMKVCELCSRTASLYCDSDQASLCYDCDQMVHSANFLVAKHSKILLCYRCQSSTSWIASGLNLGRAASTCANCSDENLSQWRYETSRTGNGVGDEYCFVYDDIDDEEVHGETDEEEIEYSYGDNEEEDGEHQVVPWSSASPPPTAGASVSSEEFSTSGFASEC